MEKREVNSAILEISLVVFVLNFCKGSLRYIIKASHKPQFMEEKGEGALTPFNGEVGSCCLVWVDLCFHLPL